MKIGQLMAPGRRMEPLLQESLAGLSPWPGRTLEWPSWIKASGAFVCGLDDQGVCRAASRRAAEVLGLPERSLIGYLLVGLEPLAAWTGIPGICTIADWLPIVRNAGGPVDFQTVWQGADRTPAVFRCRAGQLRPAADDGSDLFVIGERVAPGILRQEYLSRVPEPSVPNVIPEAVLKSLRHTSHELNNLLTAAYCTGDLLQSAPGVSGSVRKYADDLRQILDEIAALGAGLRRSIQDAKSGAKQSRSAVTQSRERRGHSDSNSRIDRLFSLTPADR